MKPEESQGVVIPVAWVDDPAKETIFANQLLISHAGGQFYLFFGEVIPPAIPNIREAGKIPEHLNVKVVSRIAVAPESMLAMARVIMQNLEGYKATEEKNPAEANHAP